jgi:hypothetical protein
MVCDLRGSSQREALQSRGRREVTHVAMAMTANPNSEPTNTKQPNCSRIGIRILTMERGDGSDGCQSGVERQPSAAESAATALKFRRRPRSGSRGVWESSSRDGGTSHSFRGSSGGLRVSQASSWTRAPRQGTRRAESNALVVAV